MSDSGTKSRQRYRADASEILAVAVAHGKSLVAAARLAGLSERTARRRVKDEAFRRRVDEIRGDLVKDAAGGLSALLGKARRVLSDLLDDPSPATRLGAVRVVYAEARAYRVTVDLEQKLAEVEALLKSAEVNRRQPIHD